MKISYTGNMEELSVKQRGKLENKLQKLSKMVEQRGEKEVRVIFSKQRHLSRVEITANAFDHSLVGDGADGDVATAMNLAIEKLEKQIVRMREKWRTTTRTLNKEAIADGVQTTKRPAAAVSAKKAAKPAKPPKPAVARVFPINGTDGNKPMTVEEAMLEIGGQQNYIVFRDAKTNRVNVLMKRADGHFDLIES